MLESQNNAPAEFEAAYLLPSIDPGKRKSRAFAHRRAELASDIIHPDI